MKSLEIPGTTEELGDVYVSCSEDVRTPAYRPQGAPQPVHVWQNLHATEMKELGVSTFVQLFFKVFVPFRIHRSVFFPMFALQTVKLHFLEPQAG